MAELVDHGNISKKDAEKILELQPVGSFLIIDGKNANTKNLVYKTGYWVSTKETSINGANEYILKNSDLTTPVLANRLIQKKTEMVDLISKKILASTQQKITIEEKK
jgi:hypothetical protein